MTRAPVVVPITTGGKSARTAGFAVTLEGAGTETKAWSAVTSRALDLSARAVKKLERVPDAIIDEVLARLTPIFE